jgi:hypothetical protein
MDRERDREQRETGGDETRDKVGGGGGGAARVINAPSQEIKNEEVEDLHAYNESKGEETIADEAHGFLPM